MTLAPPVFVTVSDKDCGLPICTLPKLRLVGLDDNAPGAVPVPESGMLRVGLDAVEVMVTLPLGLPADRGAKVTLKVELCPAVSVTGVVVPLRLYPVPLIAT